jgi:RNA polymerase sigma-70 factor (ECF subfamily)
MAQRLVRAKAKIAAARIPYIIPDATMLPDRIASVLSVIYLIFNQGYTTHLAALSDEAIRLARIIANLLPNQTEVAGLLALMLLHDARRSARTDATGAMIPLPLQNRKRWDRAKIAQGDAILQTILPRGQVGPYQLQAAISALHAGATTWDTTDWPQIAALYALLYQMQPSAVVRVNHAMAVSYAQSPQAGLAMLDTIADDPQMTRYQSYHSARADLTERSGDLDAARQSYDRAIALTTGPAEHAFLSAKRDAIL